MQEILHLNNTVDSLHQEGKNIGGTEEEENG